MRNDVKIRIETFVDFIYDKFTSNSDRLTICAVGTAQYINYLIEKGLVSSLEKDKCNFFSIDTIEKKYGSDIPVFVKNGIADIMNLVKGYEYESIGFIVKKVNEKFK